MTESEQTATHSMRWPVIYTKPPGEEIALNNLERQGYECYLPLRSLERLRRGLRVQTTEPFLTVICSSDLMRAVLSPVGRRSPPPQASVIYYGLVINPFGLKTV